MCIPLLSPTCLTQPTGPARRQRTAPSLLPIFVPRSSTRSAACRPGLRSLSHTACPSCADATGSKVRARAGVSELRHGWTMAVNRRTPVQILKPYRTSLPPPAKPTCLTFHDIFRGQAHLMPFGLSPFVKNPEPLLTKACNLARPPALIGRAFPGSAHMHC